MKNYHELGVCANNVDRQDEVEVRSEEIGALERAKRFIFALTEFKTPATDEGALLCLRDIVEKVPFPATVSQAYEQMLRALGSGHFVEPTYRKDFNILAHACAQLHNSCVTRHDLRDTMQIINMYFHHVIGKPFSSRCVVALSLLDSIRG